LPGETFKPSVPLEKLEELFPDGTHRNIKAAREYVGILQVTGQLTENKWGVLERVSGEVDGFAQALNLYEPAASQVKAAAVSAGVQAAQQTMAEQAPRVRYPVIRREAANTAGQSVQQRMAGQMPAAVPAVARAIQNATPAGSATQWSLRQGISDGPRIGRGRTNSRGYDRSKEIWMEVDGRKRPTFRVPYVEEKWKDEARNRRFEETRNPTRADIADVAGSFIRDAEQAGIRDGVIALAPRRVQGAMGGAPMWEVAMAMQEMTDGRLRFSPEALKRLSEAPSRTSKYEQGASKDLSVIYSGPVPVVLDGKTQHVSAFAGNSKLESHLNNYGVGRNRSYSEDYLTLGGRPVGGSGNILLLDDSVNQGSSQLAAALKLHELNPRHSISPLAYWGFAGAPVKPASNYGSTDRVRDVISADQGMLRRAIDDHRASATSFVAEADRYAGMAERSMRDDPVGNFLGGLLSGNSTYDQDKARKFLEAYLPDDRQRLLAVKLAAQRVDPTGAHNHAIAVDSLKRDPAIMVDFLAHWKELGL
jgi:hypothetical protein